MKIKKNGKVIILTESDLKKIVKKVLTEQKYISNECEDCIRQKLGDTKEKI